MTNHEIFLAIISAIVSGITTTIAKPIVEKAFSFAAIKAKRIRVFLRSILFLILRYGLPIFLIIKLLFSYGEIDRFWILQFCLQFFVLAVVVSYDITLFFITKNLEVISKSVNAMGRMQDNNDVTISLIKEVMETNKMHLKLTKEHHERLLDFSKNKKGKNQNN